MVACLRSLTCAAVLAVSSPAAAQDTVAFGGPPPFTLTLAPADGPHVATVRVTNQLVHMGYDLREARLEIEGVVIVAYIDQRAGNAPDIITFEAADHVVVPRSIELREGQTGVVEVFDLTGRPMG